jgi:hypothetical protein
MASERRGLSGRAIALIVAADLLILIVVLAVFVF